MSCHRLASRDENVGDIPFNILRDQTKIMKFEIRQPNN